MITSFKTKTAAIATIGVLSISGAAVAATTSGNAPTPLTGNITDQASTAALANYPNGTLVGIQSKADGTYEAEVRKADGTEVEVELDEAFKVTGTHADEMGGRGDRDGRGGGIGRGVDTAALAKTLGVTEAKLQAALQATHGTKDADKGDRAAAIAKALGATTSDVQSVLDAQGGGRGGRGGDRGGDSALVTALAKKTGKTEAEVTKALEAQHTARENAEATALAEELGIDAAKVESALAAAEPADRP